MAHLKQAGSVEKQKIDLVNYYCHHPFQQLEYHSLEMEEEDMETAAGVAVVVVEDTVDNQNH